MPRDMRGEPGSAADWLRHARSDLALAEAPVPDDVLLETLCFHAQQAAEKAIKAVLIHRGISIPRTHSIARLAQLLPAAVAQRVDLRAAAELTAYATALRYPSDDDPVTPDEHRRAIELAGTVVEWAERKTA